MGMANVQMHAMYTICMSIVFVLTTLVLRSVVQVAVFCLVSVTMVSTSVLIWTVNSKSVLQFLFLLSQFHRVHKVIDASQGPHWRWEPGLYISILTHHQHAEVVTVDLQLISETLYHILWKRLLLRLTFPCRKIFHRSFLMLQLYVFLEMRKEEEIMFKILPFNGKTPLFLKLSIQYPQSSTRQNDEYLSISIQFKLGCHMYSIICNLLPKRGFFSVVVPQKNHLSSQRTFQ